MVNMAPAKPRKGKSSRVSKTGKVKKSDIRRGRFTKKVIKKILLSEDEHFSEEGHEAGPSMATSEGFLAGNDHSSHMVKELPAGLYSFVCPMIKCPSPVTSRLTYLAHCQAFHNVEVARLECPVKGKNSILRI